MEVGAPTKVELLLHYDHRNSCFLTQKSQELPHEPILSVLSRLLLFFCVSFKNKNTHTHIVTFRTFVEHARSFVRHSLRNSLFISLMWVDIKQPSLDQQFGFSHRLGNGVLMVPHTHTW